MLGDPVALSALSEGSTDGHMFGHVRTVSERNTLEQVNY